MNHISDMFTYTLKCILFQRNRFIWPRYYHVPRRQDIWHSPRRISSPAAWLLSFDFDAIVDDTSGYLVVLGMFQLLLLPNTKLNRFICDWIFQTEDNIILIIEPLSNISIFIPPICAVQYRFFESQIQVLLTSLKQLSGTFTSLHICQLQCSSQKQFSCCTILQPLLEHP